MARREHRTALTALIPLTAAILVSAGTGESLANEHTSRFAGTLTPGATVTISQWTGRTLHGELIEITDCALVLRVSNVPVPVGIDQIKTIKRHRPKKGNRAARVMGDIASYCDEPGCAPGALMYLGVAGLIRGFDDLAHPPKVVYRAKRRPSVNESCVAPVPQR